MKLENDRDIVIIGAGPIGSAQIRHLIPEDNFSVIMIDDIEEIQERLKDYKPFPPPVIEPFIIQSIHYDTAFKTKKPVNSEWKQRMKNLQNQKTTS